MKKQQLSKILSNIYVSSPSDVRSKLRPIIGNDPYKIVNAYANYISYEKLKDKDLADMILEAKILDDELLKLLQSLSNIKATSNTLSKNDFINLFYTTLENLGYGMYINKTQLQEIINYFGYALFLISITQLKFKPFSFMLLKAKKQDRVYNIPNSSDKIEILEYTSHITWHGVKVHKE